MRIAFRIGTPLGVAGLALILALRVSNAEPASTITYRTPTLPALATTHALNSSEPAEGDIALRAVIRAKLDAHAKRKSAAERMDAAVLKSFYGARADAPLWITNGALNERAMRAMGEILNAADWGLDPSAFTLPQLGGSLTQDGAVDAELTLSLAALTYARQARGGRIEDPPKQLSSYLNRRPLLPDPKLVLEQLASLEPEAVLRDLHPKHPQFKRLRQLYIGLLEWSVLAPEGLRIPKGPMLSPGEKHKQVVLLRERLNLPFPTESGHASATDASVYDDALVAAVKAFQSEKALSPDGIVGPGTRAALNDVDVPDAEKVRANMEMWRWMPDDLGATYIWVNLPELALQVVRDGKVVLQDRMVASPADKQTPVLSATMVELAIPQSRSGPQSIKMQEPGSQDELGNFKFSFLNGRGTIRVRNPARLAELLLEIDKGWTPAQVSEIADGPKRETQVSLDTPIPIHVVYFTQHVDDAGAAHQFADIYGHEKRVMLALSGRLDEVTQSGPKKPTRAPAPNAFETFFSELFGGG